MSAATLEQAQAMRILAASDVLNSAREKLIAAYMNQAEEIIRQLTPAAMWDDAQCLIVAAKLARWELAMIHAGRQASYSYAKTLLKQIGVTPKSLPSVPGEGAWRANADPLAEAFRFATTYRGKAIRNPSVRPDSFLDSPQAQAWMQACIDRLEQMANDDMQAASVRTQTETYRRNSVKGYRRTIHPELSRTGTCGLCVAASTRLYNSSRLMPLHSNCKCTTIPVYGSKSDALAKYANSIDLEKLYKTAGGTTARDLTKTRYTTYEHGELGPAFTRSRTSAGDVLKPADKETWSKPGRAEAERQAEASLNSLAEAQKALGEAKRSGKETSFKSQGRTYVMSPESKARISQLKKEAEALKKAFDEEWGITA